MTLGIQTILIALLVCLPILYFLKPLWSHNSQPPGPFPLPFIGSLWQIGVKISKDTLIKIWSKPEAFNPNHLLDKDGHFLEREAFIPFGAGARVCLAERLAKTELFIFFTNLIRAFTFQLPEGVKELNEEPIGGVSLHPHPYKLCAVPRGNS